MQYVLFFIYFFLIWTLVVVFLEIYKKCAIPEMYPFTIFKL